MSLICPECQGPLELQEGGWARCALHGGQYKVLFCRERALDFTLAQPPGYARPQDYSPPSGPGSGAVPLNQSGGAPVAGAHPFASLQPGTASRPATPGWGPQAGPSTPSGGSFPGTPVPRPTETHRPPGVPGSAPYSGGIAPPPGGFAPPGYARPAGVQVPTTGPGSYTAPGYPGGVVVPPPVLPGPGGLRPAGPPPGGYIPPVLQGKACVGHPDVQAQYICHKCRTPICVTCAFALPGGVTLCPTCVTRPAPSSASRSGLSLGFSYGLAALAMLGLIGFFAFAGTMGDSPENAIAMVVIGIVFVLLPSVIGMGLGISTMEKNLPTSIWTWVASIWNGVILLGFLLMSVVGALMG